MLSPLQLNAYHIEDISMNLGPDIENHQNIAIRVDTQTQFRRIPEDDKHMMIEMRVTVSPNNDESDANLDFRIELTAHGFFTYLKSFSDPQDMPSEAGVTGVSLLFGMIRAEIAKLTAQTRMKQPLILPALDAKHLAISNPE